MHGEYGVNLPRSQAKQKVSEVMMDLQITCLNQWVLQTTGMEEFICIIKLFWCTIRNSSEFYIRLFSCFSDSTEISSVVSREPIHWGWIILGLNGNRDWITPLEWLWTRFSKQQQQKKNVSQQKTPSESSHL